MRCRAVRERLLRAVWLSARPFRQNEVSALSSKARAGGYYYERQEHDNNFAAGLCFSMGGSGLGESITLIAGCLSCGSRFENDDDQSNFHLTVGQATALTAEKSQRKTMKSER